MEERRMHLKPYLGLALGALFVCAISPAPAQTAADATEQPFPFAVGAGFSAFNPDFGHGHLLGGTLWIDYTPPIAPWFLRGIGIEAAARDLNYGRSASQSSNLRQDIAEGGLKYSWQHFRSFRPYGKFMMGYGNTDYDSSLNPTQPFKRYHDSRTISAIGGGMEYRISRRVWLRADYEYQFWPNFFKHQDPTLPAGQLNPQGFTIGAMYHFNSPHLP
jgi:opacity protein-like surface antigen